MTELEMNWDETIAYIMRAQHKTRRQAKAMLMQALRDGRLPSTGINSDTGKRESIPPEAWPEVH